MAWPVSFTFGVSIKHLKKKMSSGRLTPPVSAKSCRLGERRETSQSWAYFSGSGFSVSVGLGRAQSRDTSVTNSSVTLAATLHVCKRDDLSSSLTGGEGQVNSPST